MKGRMNGALHGPGGDDKDGCDEGGGDHGGCRNGGGGKGKGRESKGSTVPM